MANVITKVITIEQAQAFVERLGEIEGEDGQPGFSQAETITARGSSVSNGLFRFQSSITAANLASFVAELKTTIGVAERQSSACVNLCGGREKRDCLVEKKCGRSIQIEVHETPTSMAAYMMPVRTRTIPDAQDWRAKMRERVRSGK